MTQAAGVEEKVENVVGRGAWSEGWERQEIPATLVEGLTLAH